MAGFTPLIKKLNPNGTLVTFQSSGEDMTFSSMGNPRKRMEFSKFALLDIPPIEAPVSNDNTIQFNTIEGAFMRGLSTAAPPPEGDKVDLAQSLQNYLLNMETILIRSKDYKSELNLNVSERIFFKWLKEIGAMRYREAVVGEKASTVTDKRFVEEDYNDDPVDGDLYNRVVRYLGEIDVQGNQRYNANSYKQLYFYVPTQNGSTPTILFKTISDDNYYEGMVIQPDSLENIEYIQGRDEDDDPTPAGLTAQAFYDMDVTINSLDYEMNDVTGEVWFDDLAPNGPNAYFTDEDFNDPTNDIIHRTDPNTSDSITYMRSRLDGVTIDWTKADYKAFEDDKSLKSFGEFNSKDEASDFRFNAIMLYYDVWDVDNPDSRATNLYGIIFLDTLVTQSTSGAKIQTLQKIKPDNITRKQGNGYGIILNLKFDVTSDSVDTEIEISVNDYNTFSMVLFTDAMQRLGIANKNFEKLMMQLQLALNRLEDAEGLMLNSDNTITIRQEIESLKSDLLDVQNQDGIIDLINSLNDKVDEILSGQTEVKLSFLLDFIGKDGLKTSKVGDNVIIRNLRQRWSEVNVLDMDTSGSTTNKNNVVKLGGWDTMVVHDHGGSSVTAEGNIVIYVEDKEFTWQKNQYMKITFKDPVHWNSFGVIIYTDANDRFSNGAPYQQLIGVVPNITNDTPEIEIICVDPDKYKFVVLSK